MALVFACCDDQLEAPGGIVAVEDDGLAGSDPATLQRLSAGTRAASRYWNGIGDDAIGFARDGAVLPGTGDALPIGDDGAHPDVAAAFAGLDTSVHGITFCGLLAVERFTGVRIDGEPLEEPAAVYPLRLEGAPERLTPALGTIRAATLVYRGDEDRNALSAAIAALPATAQRRLAAVVASNLFRHVGLHTSPEIDEAVRSLTDPAGPRFSEPIEIAMLQARDAEAGGVIDLKTRAMRVLATAANPDPHLAALEAIWGVRQVLTPDIQVTFDADMQRVLDRAAQGPVITPQCGVIGVVLLGVVAGGYVRREGPAACCPGRLGDGSARPRDHRPSRHRHRTKGADALHACRTCSSAGSPRGVDAAPVRTNFMGRCGNLRAGMAGSVDVEFDGAAVPPR